MKAVCLQDLFLLALLLTLSFVVHAQKSTAQIEGQLVGSDGLPAPGVTVALKIIKRETQSNQNGFFLLRHLPALDDTLVVSSIDANPLFVSIHLRAGQTLDLGQYYLQRTVSQLQPVEIDGRLSRTYKSDYSFFGVKTQAPIIDIPQSISTVTKELIKDQMQFTLKDAATDAAGVTQYSGFDEYSIRGFRAENSRDINGLRGYNTTYTSSMLVNIERVEIIKGPTATLYGNCDPGGTINLVTKKPLEQTAAEVDLFGGTWDHFRFQGDLTGPINNQHTLLYRFNAGLDNSNSFRHGQYATSYELAPSFTVVASSKLKINLDFSVSQINSVLDWGQPGYEENNHLRLTPISLSASQPGDYLKETDMASIVTLSYKFNSRLTFNCGYLNYLTRQYVGSHGVNSYITPDSVNLYYTSWTYPTSTNTIMNYFTYSFPWHKTSNLLTFGYDYVVSRVNLNQSYYEIPSQFGVGSGIVGTFSLKTPQWPAPPLASYQLSTFDSDATDVNDNIYHTQGAYAQDLLSYNKWKVLFSLREEFYKGDAPGQAYGNLSEDVFLPRLGIVYEIRPNISAYVTYNKGFDDFEASTNTQIFYPPYKPQTSILWETGLKGNFLNNRLAASLAVYQLTLLNVAVNANDISNPNLFIQQGQNRSRGVEVEGTGNILPNLAVNLGYAYCNAIVTQSTVKSQIGTRVENAPLSSTTSWIKYTLPAGLLKGFGISAGENSAGVRNTLDPAIILPGYFVLNGGLHYQHKHYTLALEAYNLTNTTYWMGAYNNVNKWPGAPRHCMLNASYRF